MASKRINPETLVTHFNIAFPIGSDVSVRRDNGEILETKTRSVAWVMGGHSAVVMVDGIAGGYAVDRITRREPAKVA